MNQWSLFIAIHLTGYLLHRPLLRIWQSLLRTKTFKNIVLTRIGENKLLHLICVNLRYLWSALRLFAPSTDGRVRPPTDCAKHQNLQSCLRFTGVAPQNAGGQQKITGVHSQTIRVEQQNTRGRLQKIRVAPKTPELIYK